MTKWHVSDVPCVVILGTENHLVKSITSVEQESVTQPQLSASVHPTTEATLEYMGWEGELLKRYMGLPRNNS